jgi:Coenzyme PQQ synthesis protein D (PqqD)
LPGRFALGPATQSEVVAKRLDKTTVLVDMATSRIFELNETGTRIWELLGEGLDADRIMRHLVDEFGVEHARAENEVNNLLARLRADGLLEE